MFQRPSEPDINSEIVIVGAGLAGISLAIKLAELNKEVWLLGSPYESQLAKAGVLTNTDLPDDTVGLKFMEELFDKAKEKGIKHKSSLVTQISFNDKILIETKRQKFFAEMVIITTGAKQGKIDFPGEKELFHKGISDCSICDFPLYGTKVVGVLGNHEYTSRAANFLINQTQGVHLFWYQNAEKPVVDERINLYNIQSIHAFGEEVIEGVKITNFDGEELEIPLQGLFVEGAPVPATEFLISSEIELDKNNYIIIDDEFHTNKGNVFAIGDVTGKTKNYVEVMVHVEKLFEQLK